MTAQTPISRATHSLSEYLNDQAPVGEERYAGPARAALTAALTDPDIRVGMAQVMNQQDGAYQGRVSPSWEGLSENGKEFYLGHIDALTTYLLNEGETS